ncbi:VCBS repeat-containing protein [Geobacter sp. FeAm09]|uniref:FG-GAP repeat domain-containing protein n=1 Tax=Geobacter sp. FeAm09 TaxID=2597769 RepID=UPI0011ED72E2|nr:VCBS repeat-containing protein [Geobacter sp. FeAm09]QEM67037.1 VCBS repeat-containing protein [Geobacter sp. FeAm09]
MLRTLRATSFLLALFLSVTVLNASAAFDEALVRDFAPLSGYVIQPAGNEFIIDLDARQQIAVGDIFSVVTPGEKIIHPVTKEVLGTQDTVKGILQVTRIKAGYSYCRPLGAVSGIRNGDVIRRFQNIDVDFWDYTGQGEPLFKELQTTLPHLPWQGYAASQKSRPATPALPAGKSPALYFVLTSQGLEVRSPDFEIIHAYPTPGTQQARISTVTANAPAAEKSESAMISRVFDSGTETYWTSPPMKGTPVGVETGDFDGDGKQEVAVAFGDRVEIYRLAGGNYQQLATIPLGVAMRAYHLDGFDLKGNGRPQLFVSAVTDAGNLSGVMIESQDGRYRIARKGIPWHMRSLMLPGEGPILLAQEMGVQGREFSGPVFRVRLAGTELAKGGAAEVPAKANLYDFTPFRFKDRKLFACLGADGYLNIVAPDGQVVGSSVDKMGGSESYLEMTEDVQSGGESRISYLPSRIVVNENGEIVVPVNTGFSLLSRVRMFSKSEMKAMTWDGSTLRDAWHSIQEKSYLADFRLADANNGGSKALVTVVAFPDYNPLAARRAALHIYKLP